MVYGFTEIALSIVSIVVCVFYYNKEEEQQHTCRVMLDLHLLKVKCYLSGDKCEFEKNKETT